MVTVAVVAAIISQRRVCELVRSHGESGITARLSWADRAILAALTGRLATAHPASSP